MPEAASSTLLPAACGHQKAFELLLLGETFSASDAAACGFVNRILADGGVHAFAVAQAEKICGLPQGSISETKSILRRGERIRGSVTVLEQMGHEVESFSKRLDGVALREVVSAFREKRAADFTAMD